MMDGDPQNALRTVPINPGVRVLGVLRHLNYREWFALAEFVDNAVQSFLANREALALAGSERLTVRIDIGDDGTMTISDNAAGIAPDEFPRAFRSAQPPPEASGLSEFGMGMKSAACWFAPRWSVRTKALGDPVERTVRFDVARIVKDDIDELGIDEKEERSPKPYTVIELADVQRIPRTKTLGKIKEHLTDIYRQFLRQGWLAIQVKGDPLAYQEPEILSQPPEWDKEAEPIAWRKEIDFDFGQGKRAHGFAALFATASTKRAGFALFRRGRLIQGSGDEGYKPSAIFGSANSFRRQRLFGELNLEGFEVSHTKDGFQWDEEEEEAFLDLLRDHLAEEPVPLLKQADEYRARKSRAALEKVAGRAAAGTAGDVRKGLEAASKPSEGEAEEEDVEEARVLADETVSVEIDGRTWEVHVQPTTDDAEKDWLRVVDASLDDGTRKLVIRVSAHHPFTVRFVDDDERSWQAMMRAAAAMAIGQAIARGGDPHARAGAAATLRGINKALRGMGS